MDVFEGEDGIYHMDRTDDIIRNRDMAYLRQFPNVILTQPYGFLYSIEHGQHDGEQCGWPSQISPQGNRIGLKSFRK